MENEKNTDLQPEEETVQPASKPYIPRPWWQVVGAWVALLLFLGVIVFFHINLARGGF